MQNAECRMQNLESARAGAKTAWIRYLRRPFSRLGEVEPSQFSILHSAFCIRVFVVQHQSLFRRAHATTSPFPETAALRRSAAPRRSLKSDRWSCLLEYGRCVETALRSRICVFWTPEFGRRR